MLYLALLLLTAIAAIVLLSTRFQFNVFFGLVAVAFLTGCAAGLGPEKAIELIKSGIGGTIEKIGLLIILGITLGILLEKSGATASLANAVLHRTGEAKAPLALSIVGYTVGLPIFCDSGFVVLSGLLRSLSARSPKQHVWMVVALSSALYAVHCLVPPHPGITAAAATLQADIGQVMLLGALVALPVAIVGYFSGKWFNQRFDVVYQGAADKADAPSVSALPRPMYAILPIVVPVVLIALKSVLLLTPDISTKVWWPTVKLAGDPIVALFAGILLCLPLFKILTRAQINEFLESALNKSGNILLLTAAGGAFGEVIKALDIGSVFGAALASSGLGLLVPFLLAALFKTAQGSSTVAVISTAGILAPLLPGLGFDTDTALSLALLSMGAGSMAVSHTNDSYFWVVSKFGDLPTASVLRSFTLVTALQAIVALVAIWVLKLCL
jgi:gluconate:H+ symporter, GntP family